MSGCNRCESSTIRHSRVVGCSRLVRRVANLVLIATVCCVCLTATARGGDTLNVGGHTFEYLGVTYNYDGTSTWTYRVSSAEKPSLSHWVLGCSSSLKDSNVVDASEAYDVGSDPRTGLYGVKFDQGYCSGTDDDDRRQWATCETRLVSFTLDAWYEVESTSIATKAGQEIATEHGIAGPSSDAIAGNSPPVANDDHIQTYEDKKIKIYVLENDSDPEGDPLTVLDIGRPSHGTARKSGGKKIEYAPDKGFSGVDSFSYTISDQSGNTATAVVTVTVGQVNGRPEAANDAASTDENEPVVIDILANDRDPDGSIDPETVAVVDKPRLGSAQIDRRTGAVTYIPDRGACGEDSFTYTVDDNDHATSDPATVEIAIACNQPPEASDDELKTEAGIPVIINVTTNDTDADGTIRANTVNIDRHPNQGEVDVDPTTGLVTYMPDPGTCGKDKFTYHVEDDDGAASNEAEVNLAIRCNEPPIAKDDLASTDENTSIGIDIVANDSDRDGSIDRTSVTITSHPAGGTISVHPKTGLVSYTPDPGTCGEDLFRYVVQDNDGTASNEANVTISVLCNDPPLAVDDLYTVREGETLKIGEPGVLGNDVDAPGSPLTAFLSSDVSHGSLSLDRNGSFIYTHDGSETLDDEFRYVASDGEKESNLAAVRIVVSPTNDEPSAEDDRVTTEEDVPITISVLSNDHDPDGDLLAVDWIGDPSHGSAVNRGNSITYQPDPDFSGEDSFSYTVSDGAGGTAKANVTITVEPVNDPPTAGKDSASVPEDESVRILVLENDSDRDGDRLSIIEVSQPSNGWVDNGRTELTYAPDGDFHGVDTFTYTVFDEHGGTATATVTVTVTPVNDLPTAENDRATTQEDTPVSLEVLVNDRDPEGDPLTLESVGTPVNGTTNHQSGRVTYTPNPDFFGTDTFSYVVSDGNGGTAEAMVSVQVTAVNDAPIAQDDSEATQEEVPVTIHVLVNDSDPEGDALSIESVDMPTHGTVAHDTATLTYTPEHDFFGMETFAYSISDGNGGSARADVTITVAPVNDAPLARDDTAETDEETPTTIDLLANDEDPENSSMAVESLGQPKNGSVRNNGTDVTYTPNLNFFGTDQFTYVATDGDGGTAAATVTVIVSNINDAPIAQGDSESTDEETLVTIDVLANDSDPDGNFLLIASVGPVANGSVVNADTSLTYLPDEGFNGVDTFTYTVTDNNGGTATATVTVAVIGVNDPPLATDDAVTTDEDMAQTFDLLANDSDPDGDTMLILSVTRPANGSILNNGDNVLYTPIADFHGTDRFFYDVSDGNGGRSTGAVSVTVVPVNDPPISQDDSAATDEDVSVTIHVLQNDSDPDNDPLTVESITQPTNGSIVNHGDHVAYSPHPDFHGSDTFRYTVSDGQGGTDTAAVLVRVAPVNDAPLAQDDSGATDEDVSIVLSVLVNDTDPEGDPLIVRSVTQPDHGVVSIEGSYITYAPDADFHGSDTFSYSLSDGQGGIDTATVRITVAPVNDAPLAQDDSGTTDEDVSVVIPVLANDTDPDGDGLSIQSVTQPDHGSVSIEGSGLMYVPDPGFNGSDAFSYVVSDGQGGTDTGTVALAVAMVNDAPEAQDDAGTTEEDTPVVIPVLANDSDPDGDALLVQSVTQPDHGTVTNDMTDVTYTPDPNFHGSDTFSYIVSDGQGGTDMATVRMTIDPINDAPIAQDDSGATEEDHAVFVPVLGNDSDPEGDRLIVQTVTQPDHGFVTIEGVGVTYTPDPDFFGIDRFIYSISDENGRLATATVGVTVTPINDVPIARDDSTQTDEETPTIVDLLSNDEDPESSPLVIESVRQPSNGSVVNNGTDVTYTPNPDFFGTDSFTYVAADGDGGIAEATVFVTVSDVNDPPTAQDDSETTDEETPVTINVLANDNDVDGNRLTILSVTQPANGSVVQGETDLSYQPDPGFNGVDTFVYTVTDGHGGTATATVTVAIAGVNDAPAAVDDEATLPEDTQQSLDVLANDSDPDGDLLLVLSMTQPTHGSAVNDGTRITYIPNADFHGVDRFTYIASDGNGGTDEATVTLAITGVNDRPTAQDDSGQTTEDSSIVIIVLENDDDPDGDTLSVTSVTRPANGTVSSDGTHVTYTPDPDFSGSDAFAYSISDGNGGTDEAAVTIVVAPVNDAPVAQDDSVTTDEDTQVAVSVLANDFDPEADPLRVESVVQPSHGTAAIGGEQILYTPAPGFHGMDSFTYTVADGNGATAMGTVTVAVATVNDPPIAQTDSAATHENSSVTIAVLLNDSDPDGDSLTVQSVGQPANGSASTDGSVVTYVADPSFNGTDSFPYVISDGNGGTATALVTVAVASVNDPPIAQDDAVTTHEDLPISISALSNDADPDGDSLMIESVTQPGHGAVVPSGATLVYTPSPGFFGADAFTYVVSDGRGKTDTATVAITVLEANDSPIAQDDSITTRGTDPIEIAILGNDTDPDGDPLVVESIVQPAGGTVINNFATLSYIPRPGFSGTDTFEYTISDGRGRTDTATVIVTVTAENRPPVAQDDSAATDEGVLVTISVLANDNDPDGDFLVVETFTHPQHGTVLNARTGISYIPDPGFQGIDSFVYSVSDGNGGNDTATVTVAVAGANNPPLAQDDNGVTDEGVRVTVPVLINDGDPDGDDIVIESVTDPEHGIVVNDKTSLTYIPNPGFSGVDAFEYTISDGNGGTATATVFVAIASVDDPPTAQNDSSTTEEGEPVSISVLSNDSDPDNDTLIVTSVTLPAHGTATVAGLFVNYVPDEGFVGTDTFSYTVADDRGNEDSATVTVGIFGGGGGGGDEESLLPHKVVISEVAWAGTAADPSDEWIELRNLDTAPVNLDGWELRWRRSHPSTPQEQIWKTVQLSGVVPAASGAVIDDRTLAANPEVSLSKQDAAMPAWFLSVDVDDPETGFFVLERRHDDAIGDVQADLLYDIGQKQNLELSDLGEVIMLVDDLGNIIDTANASNLGRDGWAAGSATTFGTMERTDPSSADTAANWHTNAGIVAHGENSRGHLLRATPGGANSPVFEELAVFAKMEPSTVRAGDMLNVDFVLPRQDRRTTGWPWIGVSRPGLQKGAGAGGAVDLTGYSFSGRYETGDRYVLDIGTQSLSPGSYTFWVTYGHGRAVVVPIIVAR